MRGPSSDRIVQTNPHTLALSPRFVVSVLRDSLAGERGQMKSLCSPYFKPREFLNRLFDGRSNSQSQSSD
jgi:hypothetical protein